MRNWLEEVLGKKMNDRISFFRMMTDTQKQNTCAAANQSLDTMNSVVASTESLFTSKLATADTSYFIGFKSDEDLRESHTKLLGSSFEETPLEVKFTDFSEQFGISEEELTQEISNNLDVHKGTCYFLKQKTIL